MTDANATLLRMAARIAGAVAIDAIRASILYSQFGDAHGVRREFFRAYDAARSAARLAARVVAMGAK